MMTPVEIDLVITSEKFHRERTNGPRSHARFWVPFLCLLHDMRSNEPCQLLVSDVKEDEDIPSFSFQPVDDEGKKVKTFKTKASIRRIHFTARSSRSGSSNLLMRKEPQEGNDLADCGRKSLPISPIRRERSLFTPSVTRSSVSFATMGFRTACNSPLGGWVNKKSPNSSVEHGDSCGTKALKDAIDRVKHPGVDFSPLYLCSSAV